MNTWTTIPRFYYLPDTQDYHPITTPALPVLDGSALYQQPASPADTDTVSLAQKYSAWRF